jgi:hypothetical protein
MTDTQLSQEWHHPLIRQAPARLDRRRLIALVGGAALATRVTVAAAQTPVAEPSGDDDAVDLLAAAASAMAELETFAYSLETTRGNTRIMDILELKSVSGVVRRPYDFETTVVASLGVGEISLRAVGIDGTVYLQDPMAEGESYMTVSADPTILAFLNPDYLLLQAVGVVQDARLDGTEDFEGIACDVVIGTVELGALVDIIPSETSISPFDTEAEPLDVVAWIDEDRHVRGIEFTGGIFQGETFNVTRLLRFSSFNDPVEITAPDV